MLYDLRGKRILLNEKFISGKHSSIFFFSYHSHLSHLLVHTSQFIIISSRNVYLYILTKIDTKYELRIIWSKTPSPGAMVMSHTVTRRCIRAFSLRSEINGSAWASCLVIGQASEESGVIPRRARGKQSAPSLSTTARHHRSSSSSSM